MVPTVPTGGRERFGVPGELNRQVAVTGAVTRLCPSALTYQFVAIYWVSQRQDCVGIEVVRGVHDPGVGDVVLPVDRPSVDDVACAWAGEPGIDRAVAPRPRSRSPRSPPPQPAATYDEAFARAAVLSVLTRLDIRHCSRPYLATMDQIYRFRSCHRLLGTEGELSSRMIYFAESSQLNDPMEDARRLVWHGDQIAWTNLFRHFLNCLNHVYIRIRLGNYEPPIAPTDIPINEHWDQLPTDEYAAMIDQIWTDVKGQLPLEQIAFQLEKLRRRVYSSELEFYVGSIHECAFSAMDRAHADFGMRELAAPVSERLTLLSPVLPKYLESLMHGLDDPEELDAALEELHHYLATGTAQSKGEPARLQRQHRNTG